MHRKCVRAPFARRSRVHFARCLTVNSSPMNLKALCQRCHMLHDREEHHRQRWLTLRMRKALGDLFSGPYRSKAKGCAPGIFTGYAPFNARKAVKAPSVKNTLAERTMPEADALLKIRMESNTRNRALLTLAYGGGLRISEVCGLRWRDLALRNDGAEQATVYGKGGKTRVILLSANTWPVLEATRGIGGPDAPVFRSQKVRALDPSAVHRIVKAAAARAKLSPNVSAHWLRHAHASHTLYRGAPIHPSASDLRACQRGHYGSLHPCPTFRQLYAVSGGVAMSRGLGMIDRASFAYRLRAP